MKKTVQLVVCLAIILLNNSVSRAQTNDWMRVSSDDGEFSIEVPADYSFFYNKDGFWASVDQNNYLLQNMNLLNAYVDGTLLSFESYETKKGGMDILYKIEKMQDQNDDIKFSEIKSNGITIKQSLTNNDKFYCLRQFFISKSHIYVLTVASKNSADPIMKRFLDSLIFKPDTKEKPISKSVLFSTLRIAPVEIIEVTSEESDKRNPNPNPTPPDLKDFEPLTVVRTIQPSYTDSAKRKDIVGNVIFRVVFNKIGFISKIEIKKTLPEGLTRQAVFAALRVKFLPQMRGGKPVNVAKPIIFNYSMY